MIIPFQPSAHVNVKCLCSYLVAIVHCSPHSVLSVSPVSLPHSLRSSWERMEGNSTLCSTHCATASNFLSWRAWPISCKPMGSPRLDKAVGTVTAGRPRA